MASEETDLTKIESKLESIQKTMDGLIQINARLTQEIIHIKNGQGGGVPETRVFNSAVNTAAKPVVNNSIIIKVDGDDLLISGNTYKYRGIFGEHGGKWDKDNKRWKVDSSKKDDIVASFDEKEIKYTVE